MNYFAVYLACMKVGNPKNGPRQFSFADGSSRRVVELETVFVGKGTYLPGWRWSKDVGSQTGKASERHIGYVLKGSFMVQDVDGNEMVVNAGEAFEVGPGHDGWVVGDARCIALDFIQK